MKIIIDSGRSWMECPDFTALVGHCEQHKTSNSQHLVLPLKMLALYQLEKVINLLDGSFILCHKSFTPHYYDSVCLSVFILGKVILYSLYNPYIPFL